MNESEYKNHRKEEETTWDLPTKTPLSLDEIIEVTAEIRFS